MTPLAYLAVAVAVSLVGSLVIYLRARRPTSMQAGIEEFSRGMKALAPEHEPRVRSHVEPERPGEGGQSAG